MNKIKVIDLLNMISNSEEVPKKIRYINSIWEYNEETKDYIHDDLWLIYSMNSIGLTKREVEIIEEDKKIPEKLGDILRIDDLEPPFDNNLEKIWIQTIKNHNKINEVLDYLKSKGE